MLIAELESLVLNTVFLFSELKHLEHFRSLIVSLFTYSSLL